VLDESEALIDGYAILDALDEMHGRERARLSRPQAPPAAPRCATRLAAGVADKAVAYIYARLFAPSLDPVFHPHRSAIARWAGGAGGRMRRTQQPGGMAPPGHIGLRGALLPKPIAG
jgi:hypothetical protein